jgi:hypothetical protein
VPESVVEKLHMMNVENVEDLESQKDTAIVSNIMLIVKVLVEDLLA